MSWWQRLKTRYGETMEQFGKIAVSTYFFIFFATLFGFWLAIKNGFEPTGSAANLGTIGAAYAATKVTQPARIGATIVLSPLIAAALARFRPAPQLPEDSGGPSGAA